MRERLLTYVSEKGTLLEPDAMSYLLSQADPLSRLERLLTSLPSTPLVPIPVGRMPRWVT